MSFDTFNLDPTIMSGIRALGFETPTPIQEQAIPPIMQGHDLIGIAQTGTGKTAAFVLPILQRLVNRSTDPVRPSDPVRANGPVRAAVISPTRELAEQTCEAIGALGYYTGLTSLAVYGGVSMDVQLRGFASGVDIVVGCPGRMLDHLWRGSFDASHLEFLVIDEADRLFDMGFQPSIEGILECLLHRRQTLLFSATMPDDIRHLVKKVLHDPVTVQIGHSRPAATVSHALYPVKQHLKTPLLIQVLRRIESESVLIFTRTKLRTEHVARQLQRAGFRATSIQGNLSQDRRQAALDAFRAGSKKILVATDIAARGIDVLSISHVINYDMPDSLDAYTHRIGRTGRVDQTGEALTFVTGQDMAMVHDLEQVLNEKIDRRTLSDFDYDAPPPEGEGFRAPPRRPHRRPVRA